MENKAIKILMDKRAMTAEEAENAYNSDVLSINTGGDGNDYAWYFNSDTLDEFAINLDTGTELSADEIDNLLT